jgi:hypothetical protein
MIPDFIYKNYKGRSKHKGATRLWSANKLMLKKVKVHYAIVLCNYSVLNVFLFCKKGRSNESNETPLVEGEILLWCRSFYFIFLLCFVFYFHLFVEVICYDNQIFHTEIALSHFY